jgi:hypothetical protein
MASKFDNHMILRVVLIIVAAFVLFGLVSYYNSKQSSVKAETERFFQELKTDKVNPTPVRDSPPLLLQPNNDKAKADAVQPAEEIKQSDFRTVDFSESKLPSDCFPRDRLTAEDLLPSDAANSKWAQVNPAGQGDVSNVNFLSAAWHTGINTVSGSLRNANLQLRSEPPNPRGSWPIMNSTIEPDLIRKPLEIGEDC